MAELDPSGARFTAIHDGWLYELHDPSERAEAFLSARDEARTLRWQRTCILGELVVRDLLVGRDPLTNRVLVTADGEHWRGGTPLRRRWLIAADGTPCDVFEYEEGELRALSEAQRRAILTAVVLAASADGGMDPREIALARALFDGAPWGVTAEVIAADLQAAQVRARAIRSPAEAA